MKLALASLLLISSLSRQQTTFKVSGRLVGDISGGIVLRGPGPGQQTFELEGTPIFLTLPSRIQNSVKSKDESLPRQALTLTDSCCRFRLRHYRHLPRHLRILNSQISLERSR